MRFSTLLGQAKAQTLLGRAVESGRLAHAYLFSGPDGVGKTTMALELAAVLLCRAPVSEGPCGTCAGCLQFRSGNHPDFLRIRPDGAFIKIDQIRALKKALQFAPLEGERRVVLLEGVESMRREAGNSLLKLLEEPPAGNLLILIGNATGALLATIVSRCQVIPFAPLPVRLAAEVVQRHRPKMPAEDCQALAALCDGCPGQALTLDAEGFLPLHRRLIRSVVIDHSGPGARVEAALALAGELAACKEGEQGLLGLLRIFFKNSLAATIAPECQPFSAEVVAARERWNSQQLSDKIVAIDRAQQALARNCNRSLTTEVLLLDLFDCCPPLHSNHHD